MLSRTIPSSARLSLVRVNSSTASLSAAALGRRGLASSHHHDDHHDAPVKLHKEEYLKVAREWPHEYYAPMHHPPQPPSKIKYPSDHPDGSETLETPETFFNAFWGRVLLFAGVSFGAYQLNEYVTAGQEVHPITRIIGSFMKTQEEIDAEVAHWIAVRRKEADDLLILQRRPERPIYRVMFPDVFSRASDHLIEPGSQIDVSDVKIKHQWQQDDDLFGPPFPKNQ
ncbi:hypothetical protein HDV05_006442 [Chytridiales sp. JEL 0842]|nr:hypothetical protein HDV05_006442 [Chytridiales sp. JEL 0842]